MGHSSRGFWTSAMAPAALVLLVAVMLRNRKGRVELRRYWWFMASLAFVNAVARIGRLT